RNLPLSGIEAFAGRLDRLSHFRRGYFVENHTKGTYQYGTVFAADGRLFEAVNVREEFLLPFDWERLYSSYDLAFFLICVHRFLSASQFSFFLLADGNRWT